MSLRNARRLARRGKGPLARRKSNWLLRNVVGSAVISTLVLGQLIANTGFGVPAAYALPGKGNVTAGSATITSSSTRTNIIQSSSSAIIQWQGFNIKIGQTVDFIDLLGPSSITLNRILGYGPSRIDGNLISNGQLFFINPYGMIIGRSGVINVGSLLFTTSNISDSDFLAGNFDFNQSPGSGVIINRGEITAASGGYVVLSAPSVQNQGLIQVDLGTVVMGGAKTFAIDLNGDGLLTYQITGPVDAVPVGPDGKPVTNLVDNSGTIATQGGRVLMTAQTIKNIVGSVINMDGMIQATSASIKNGEVVLDGGSQGNVTVSGTIDASGKQAGQTGGSISVTGQNVEIQNGATLDASGDAGGGQVLVGGGLHGGGTLAHATDTTVASGATLLANAETTGDGGTVVVWSDDSTNAVGTLQAKGGSVSGNGGTIETSGHTLDFTGARVDTSAANGQTGTWILDPYNLTIDSGAASTIESDLNSTSVLIQTTASGTSTPGIQSSGAGDITIAAPLTWSANTLTLDAYNNININASVSATGTAALTLVDGDTGSNGLHDNLAATLNFSNGGNITFANTSEALSINGNPYTLVNNIATLAADIAITPSGYYALANSYNASGDSTYSTSPITTLFTGTFEGLGNTISGLKITSSDQFVGLFGSTDTGSVISDINLTNVAINYSYVDNTLTNAGDAGALVGHNLGTVSGSSSSGTITADSVFAGVGGLVGANGGTVSQSTSSVAVAENSQHDSVGGLVGGNAGTVTQSSASGTVTDSQEYANVGGLVGWNKPTTGSITNSFATGNVSDSVTVTDSDSGPVVGGLVGLNDSGATITQSWASGNVTSGGGADITHGAAGGGLVGLNVGSITLSYATGELFDNLGFAALGGLVGWNTGSITNAYATGAVTDNGGNGGIGGLIGRNDGSITDVYSVGLVSASGSGNLVGGLIGWNTSSGSVTDGYWDEDTAGPARYRHRRERQYARDLKRHWADGKLGTQSVPVGELHRLRSPDDLEYRRRQLLPLSAMAIHQHPAGHFRHRLQRLRRHRACRRRGGGARQRHDCRHGLDGLHRFLHPKYVILNTFGRWETAARCRRPSSLLSIPERPAASCTRSGPLC